MTVKVRGAILLILVALALVAGCLGGNSDTTSTQPPLPPDTTPPPTTAGPLTEGQIKDKIRQDLIGRQLSTTSSAYTYAVKPDDVRTFEQEILDGLPVWKVTVVASNTTFPYRWFVYYTTSGTLYRTHKQF